MSHQLEVENARLRAFVEAEHDARIAKMVAEGSITMVDYIELAYRRNLERVTDIHTHLPRLRQMASMTRRGLVAEFGVREGCSTSAFLCGLADRGGGALWSYDILPKRVEFECPSSVTWAFIQADTGALSMIPEVDILFVDTLHTAEQVAKEIRHAPAVAKWLVFHDTVIFGTGDESPGTGPGILEPIKTLIGNGWCLAFTSEESNGLWILERT